MTGDITVAELYEHPIVQQLLTRIENQDLEKEVTVPYIVKDRILMGPGTWNGLYYSPQSIHMAYNQSDFESKEVRSLFLDHADKNAREWIGEIINVRQSGDTTVGDLVIVDKSTAMKLHYGAKFGISPKLHGTEDGGMMQQFVYDNFSIVINPAVKIAYINNSEGSKLETEDVVSPQAIVETEGAPAPKEETIEETPAPEAPEPEVPPVGPEVKGPEEEEVLSEDKTVVMNEHVLSLLGKILEELQREKTHPQPAPCECADAKLEETPEPEPAPTPEPVPEPTPEVETPAPAEEPNETEEELSEKDNEIEELKRKLAETEAKLNKPAIEMVKTEELRETKVDSTSGLLKALKRQGGLE